MSANSVFQHMLEQIAQLEKDQASSDSLGFTNIGGKAMSRKPGTDAAQSEGQSPEDVIKNVERMLAAEKAQAKSSAKGGAKLTTLDMNEGIVGSLGKTAKGGESSSAAGGAEGELDEDIEVIKRKN